MDPPEARVTFHFYFPFGKIKVQAGYLSSSVAGQSCKLSMYWIINHTVYVVGQNEILVEMNFLCPLP